MEKPNYSSTPNEAYEVTNSKGENITIHHSRSCAVTMMPVFYIREKDEFFIPLGKRGPAAPDSRGKWCIPCGYMDWDESATQAAYRETMEEIGLFLDPIARQQEKVGYLIAAIDDQPWHVMHLPAASRQNVTLSFAVVVEWEGELPELTTKYNEVKGEVSELKWASYKEVESSDKNDFAFNHDQKIKDFMFILSPYMKVYNNSKR
jgi:ADP-ribose pyrophosphatase YjhB (NUDIX family)